MILSHTYANGLVLLAEPMESVESVAFTFRVPAGTAVEPHAKGGLAGLTCELILRGAGKRDNRQFVNDLDNLGVERGETVGDAHVVFRGATLARNLSAALEIYADILRRPHLPDEQFEPCRLMALQELAAIEDEPGHKVMLELRRRHFADPWGRPSQGEQAALESMTLGDVQEHFRQVYRPNGTILGVAGRINWDTLKDAVGWLLGDWPNLTEPQIHERAAGPPRDHLPHESNQTQIGLAYPSVAYRDDDYYVASAAVGVLGDGMSSRLFTEVREKRGLCYSVYASHGTLLDRGSVFCYAGTSAERAQETLDVMLHEIVRLSEGIEAGELERLKARIKSSLIMQQESTSARSALLTRDWYFLGRVRSLDEVEAIVDRLSAQQINRYLADHRPEKFTIVTLGPKPLEVPVGIS
ncbi:MAG TPA: pitrilysin family protein [Pirellulales bacterium]|jgi:predicted Zn-dependent peptidase|nr:pitrilysin family protein [Pirellulales bacterium]